MFWFLLFPLDGRKPLEVAEAIRGIKCVTEVGWATNMWAERGFVWTVLVSGLVLLATEAEPLHGDTVKQ